jgi:hypothetical protein
MTDPTTGAAVANPLTEVIVTFSRPVSCEVNLSVDQQAASSIELKASALKVDGKAATTVTDVTPAGSRFRAYRFTGFAAPPAGAVNIALTGTASYASRNWAVTVNP